MSPTVFRNRWLDTDIKRIMLLAVIRPIVEYGATVWHANRAQQQSLETIQNQILSRLAGSPSNISQHILRMDMGCRSFKSWADQRKLEYYYRLQNMSDARLPKQVWTHPWHSNRRRGGQSTMWSKHVERVAASAGMDLPAACEAASSYKRFKKQVATSIRTRDFSEAQQQASKQSTLERYLQLLNPSVTIYPNTIQPYLCGPKNRGSSLKLQFRSSTAQVNHREAIIRRHSVASNSCPCCQHGDETCQHVVMDCPRFEQLRRRFEHKLGQLVGGPKMGQFSALSRSDKYAALVGDRFEWGEQRVGVDSAVKLFLVDLMEARSLAIRGHSAADQSDNQAVGGAGPHGQEHV